MQPPAYDLDAQFYGLPAAAMLETAVAHEAGRQWFYNVMGNDQIGEPWLDEAVVQYLTGVYYVETHGRRGAKTYLQSWDWRWDQVDHAGILIGLPTTAYDSSNYGAIVYERGLLFIASLEADMEAQAFDAFLRDYYAAHRWGVGAGEAFRRLAEQRCACDLTSLFEAWVYAK